MKVVSKKNISNSFSKSSSILTGACLITTQTIGYTGSMVRHLRTLLSLSWSVPGLDLLHPTRLFLIFQSCRLATRSCLMKSQTWMTLNNGSQMYSKVLNIFWITTSQSLWRTSSAETSHSRQKCLVTKSLMNSNLVAKT